LTTVTPKPVKAPFEKEMIIYQSKDKRVRNNDGNVHLSLEIFKT